jgi:hypothetical protein
MKEINEFGDCINTFSIFHNIYSDAVLGSFFQLIESIATHETRVQVKAYCRFVSELYKNGGNLSGYVLDFIKKDVNAYIKLKAMGKSIPKPMQQCVESELSMLNEIAGITSGKLKDEIDYPGFLPDWENNRSDLQRNIWMLPAAPIPTVTAYMPSTTCSR